MIDHVTEIVGPLTDGRYLFECACGLTSKRRESRELVEHEAELHKSTGSSPS